ncbi:MAG: hypothetical protein ACM3SY_09425 [Candidatus Omnitrophota bacterium]
MPSMISKTPVKLFVASGSELSEERDKTILILNKLNKTHPHLHLEAVEWETDLPSGSYNGKKIQEEINPYLEACDIVLVLFYSKTGNFTLEEYHLALEKNKKVFLYFKTGFSPKKKKEAKMYLELMEFKEEVEIGNNLLFREYNELQTFENKLKDDLTLYLSQAFPHFTGNNKKELNEHSVTDVRDILFNGSKKYYESLTGPNGRFRHLNISEILLASTKHDWIETSVEINKSFVGCQEGDFIEKKTLKKNPVLLVREALEALYRDQCRHAMVVGEGGMGKTVSLLHWWEKLLNNKQSGPIPVFIALNEINSRPENQRHDFILDMIREHYGEFRLTLDQIKPLMKTPLQGGQNFIPSMVLLLDGQNEVTVDNQLVLEIKTIAEQYPGVQIVITGRWDIRKEWGFIHWGGLMLKPLEDHQIAEYLKKIRKNLPEGTELKNLIRNPMMLTLYTASCEIQENHQHTPGCDFKPDVETPGELLWNFMQAQVAVWRDKLGQDEKQIAYYKFLLIFLLPGLGYEMEKAGLFAFTKEQLDQHIDALCVRFSYNDFFDTFIEYEKFIEVLPVEELKDFKQIKKRNTKIRGILIQEMSMLVEERGMYRFLHQNFRDFFAAVHVLNEVEMSVKKGEIPSVLKERVLDYFVRRFMGEFEGEHRVKPYIVEGEGWKIDINRESFLHQALDLCRGKFNGAENPIGYAVWNIVEIWKLVRAELTGADLTRLDLSEVSLNGVTCSCYYYNQYLLAANFEGSRVHEKNVLPQGHKGGVKSAVYSSDGKRILSASDDHTIKEWDAETGQCIKTISGHKGWVRSAVYRSDGKRILSTSRDGINEWDAETGQCNKTLYGHFLPADSVVYRADGKRILSAFRDGIIKEWDAETGQCIKTISGHDDIIWSVVYHADGKRILSASDCTIKEWDAETGQCLKTLSGHDDVVISAVYSSNGKRILSAFRDGIIKEWDAETGQCIKTISGHDDIIWSVVYRADGKRILSASSDHTIKEWDAETGQCIKTLTGHEGEVNSAVYRADGKRILSASADRTIKEWDAETGQCIKTFSGYAERVTSMVYRSDGKRILSASDDHTIKEWDADTGQCIKTFSGHKSDIISAKYSEDGKHIISTYSDHTLKEWDAETGQCIKIIFGYEGGVRSAFYRADGKRILTASDDHTIKEWDAKTGQCLKTLSGHTSAVVNAVYRSDGKRILSASHDRTIKEWDAETGQCVKTLTEHEGAVNSAVYRADGKRILSASHDRTIKEWDAETGQCIKTITGHEDYVWSAVYRVDEKRILSTSCDYTIKEWDAETGKCIRTNIIEYALNFPVYEPNDMSISELKIINVPGLLIQGCSFENLEQESDWTEKGLKIMKQYCHRISISGSQNR